MIKYNKITLSKRVNTLATQFGDYRVNIDYRLVF